MFTGLVEATGRVVEMTPGQGSTRLGIAFPQAAAELERGESVAVDGVCLTVRESDREGFAADAIAETLTRTTLGGLRPGERVNLERALRVGDRLGGHLVQGHVDGTVAVLAVRRRGDDWRVELELPSELSAFVAFKGSVTLQGVSLTVAALSQRGFEVALIPETIERTTLGDLEAGRRVNLEVDLVARYLERLVRADEDAPSAEPGRRIRRS